MPKQKKQNIKEYMEVNGKWSFFRTKEFLILIIIVLTAFIILVLLQSIKFKIGKIEYDPVIKKIEVEKKI